MKNHYHVLIIEDDSFIRKVLRHTLGNEFKITTKENGIEGMSWLEEGNPVDIILSDLQMPYMNGKNLISMLRASPVFRRIPIIVLSSLTDSDTRIACLNMGADDYITKPFNPIEVISKINVILRRTESNSVN